MIWQNLLLSGVFTLASLLRGTRASETGEVSMTYDLTDSGGAGQTLGGASRDRAPQKVFDVAMIATGGRTD